MEDYNPTINKPIRVGGHRTIEKPVWINQMGGFNDMPTPYKEVELSELLNKMLSWDWENEFRQVIFLDNGIQNVRIFWFNDCGYALFGDYWTKKYTVYHLGCEHKNTVEKKLSHMYYRNTCKDCGYSHEYDTS